MQNLTRIYLSDLHMTTTEGVTSGPGKHAYGWLSPPEAQVLGDFLRSSTVAECDQLFLVGDTIDQWTCPHDVRPPTTQEIIDAPHNKPIVDGLRAFAAKPGKQVFYIRGNHDMDVSPKDALQLVPGIHWRPYYVEPPLRVHHGHEDCLFNGADPAGRKYPLGYFISRLTASGDRCGAPGPCRSFRSILKSAKEVACMVERKPLSECVIDTVLDATGVKLDDGIVMPDGSSISVRDVRATYKNLVKEWNEHRKVDAMSVALPCEWSPWYSLPVGTHWLSIVGHSHHHEVATNGMYGAYMNLGSWCDGKAFFGRTWLENAGERDELLCGEIFEWEPGVGPQSRSTRLRVPTR